MLIIGQRSRNLFSKQKPELVKRLVAWHLSHTQKKWNLSQLLFQNQNYQILPTSKYRGKIFELKIREFKCHLKLRQTDNICKRNSLSWSNIFERKKSYGLIIFRRDFLPRIVLMWVTHLRASEISLLDLLLNYFFLSLNYFSFFCSCFANR